MLPMRTIPQLLLERAVLRRTSLLSGTNIAASREYTYGDVPRRCAPSPSALTRWVFVGETVAIIGENEPENFWSSSRPSRSDARSSALSRYHRR
jgi:long-chain acyl-CoA synthetase